MNGSRRSIPLLLTLAASCGGTVGIGPSSDGGAGADTDTGVSPSDAALDAADASSRVPIQLSAGVDYTCALFSDGTVSCWGETANGLVGGPDPNPTPVPGVADEEQAAVGAFADCLLSHAGAVSCFGDDEYGTVGDGQSGEGVVVSAPTQIAASQVQSVSMGFAFGCALDVSGAVSCWGWNSAGQIGPGGGPVMQVDATPTPVSGLPPIGIVATGASHACALSLDRQSVSCWGQDVYGELGDGMSGTGHDRSTPGAVVGLPSGLASLASGGGVNCVVTDTGNLWCWGLNAQALIGTGAPGSPVTTPTQVAGLSGVARAAIGNEAACALTTTGATYCWGEDLAAANAPDASSIYVSPAVVGGVPMAAQVAVGNAHACVLGIDGTVWCWGANDAGQCGPLASGNIAATPAQVPF